MMVQEEEAMGISVHDWHIRIERTTVIGFRTLLSSRLRVQITTRSAASYRARDSRFARCHSTFCSTFGWLGLFPIA